MRNVFIYFDELITDSVIVGKTEKVFCNSLPDGIIFFADEAPALLSDKYTFVINEHYRLLFCNHIFIPDNLNCTFLYLAVDNRDEIFYGVICNFIL